MFEVHQVKVHIFGISKYALSLDVPQTWVYNWPDFLLFESKHVATLIDNKLAVFWLNLLLEYPVPSFSYIVNIRHKNIECI